MTDSEIRTGVQVENVHWKPDGHRYEIGYVSGKLDNSVVYIEMIGPNGQFSLQRSRKTVRDHFRIVHC